MGYYAMAGVPSSEVEAIRKIVTLSDREAALITSWSRRRRGIRHRGAGGAAGRQVLLKSGSGPHPGAGAADPDRGGGQRHEPAVADQPARPRSEPVGGRLMNGERRVRGPHVGAGLLAALVSVAWAAWWMAARWSGAPEAPSGPVALVPGRWRAR